MEWTRDCVSDWYGQVGNGVYTAADLTCHQHPPFLGSAWNTVRNLRPENLKLPFFTMKSPIPQQFDRGYIYDVSDVCARRIVENYSVEVDF